MSRVRTTFHCSDCGASSPTWVGRCPSCREWNTLVEERDAPASVPTLGTAAPALPIAQVDLTHSHAVTTGVFELDRVLGGGLVAGSATLLGGEPGIGKSTLALQVAAEVARGGRRVLYVSAEESASQVRARADRLGAVHDELWLSTEADVPALQAQAREVHPQLIVVDSIQTVRDPALGSAAGLGRPGARVRGHRSCARPRPTAWR